jgi:hypothetical protein
MKLSKDVKAVLKIAKEVDKISLPHGTDINAVFREAVRAHQLEYEKEIDELKQEIRILKAKFSSK